MLQSAFIRANKEKVLDGLQKKHFQDIHLVGEIISLDDQRKKLQAQSDELLSQRNIASKSIGALIAQGKQEEAATNKSTVAALKDQIDALTSQLNEVEQLLNLQLIRLPNMPNELVPSGKRQRTTKWSNNLPTCLHSIKEPNHIGI